MIKHESQIVNLGTGKSHSILEIMNTAGQIVSSHAVSLQEGNNTVSLQLGLLPEGVYFLRYGLDVIKLVKY